MKFFAMTLSVMMILPWISVAQTTETNKGNGVRKVQVIRVMNGGAVVTDTVITDADPQDTGLVNMLLELYGIDTLASGSRTMVKKVVIPKDGELLDDDVLKIVMDGLGKGIVVINGEVADSEMADSVIHAQGLVGNRRLKMIKVSVKMEDVGECDLQLLEDDGVQYNKKGELPVENLTLYPNPSQGEFNLSFSLPHKGTALIRVMDQNGKEVFKDRVTRFSGVYNRSVDLTGKASGVYFLVIEQNGKTITKKLILQ